MKLEIKDCMVVKSGFSFLPAEIRSGCIIIETDNIEMAYKCNQSNDPESVNIIMLSGLQVITADLSVYDTLLAEYAADTIKAPDDFRGITAKDIKVLNFGMPENCPKCGSKLEKEDRKTSHGGIVREMSCKNCSQDTFQKDITELMAVYEGRLVPYGETR